jgi:hypothetical protein
VDVVLVRNVLLVHPVRLHPLRSVPVGQRADETSFKLPRKIVNHRVRVLRKQPHLPQMTFARRVALEPVLVAALLLAHLAVPTQFLQTHALLAVADGFRRQCVVLGHGFLGYASPTSVEAFSAFPAALKAGM